MLHDPEHNRISWNTEEHSGQIKGMKVGEEILIHAEGNPAQVVAVGFAAAVVVAVGVGYGACCGVEKLLGWIFDD
jgi:hypothetical protein